MADYAAEELREAHDALSDAAVLRDGGTDKASSTGCTMRVFTRRRPCST